MRHLPTYESSTTSGYMYPMHAIPMDSFLEIDVVNPHQVYQSRNLLRIPEDTDTVIFISHEWLGRHHPDVHGTQLKVMQEGLRNIFAGAVDIREFWTESYVLDVKTTVDDATWVEKLRTALVWFDYLSVPQITFDPTCGPLWEKAIQSIPHYVSRADCLFVLAPPMLGDEQKLSDRELKGYSTWASRGWCAVEHLGTSLAVNGVNGGSINPNSNALVIRVNSAYDMCFCPQAALLYTQIGKRTFSCCDRMHSVPTSTSFSPRSPRPDLPSMTSSASTVEIGCDKARLFPAVVSMFMGKLNSLAEGTPEDVRCYRALRALMPFYLAGFDRAEEILTKELHIHVVSVSEFLKMYKFKSVYDNDEGWTPLRCAALAGNVKIVSDLLHRFKGISVNAPFPKSNVSGTWGVTKGCNIICHTAHWAHTHTHRQILDLLYFTGHAKLRQNKYDVLNASVVRRTLKGETNHGAEWVLDTFPDYDVNQRSLKRVFPLLILVYSSSNLPLVKRLIEEHGAKLRRRFAISEYDVIWAACAADFDDLEVVDYIYEAMINQLQQEPQIVAKKKNCFSCFGPSPSSSSSWSVNSKSNMSPYFYYKIRAHMRLFGACDSGRKKLCTFYKSTLLHSAVHDGKINVCQWLLRKRADTQARDQMGETPLMVAKRLGLSHIFHLLEETGHTTDDTGAAA